MHIKQKPLTWIKNQHIDVLYYRSTSYTQILKKAKISFLENSVFKSMFRFSYRCNVCSFHHCSYFLSTTLKEFLYSKCNYANT